MGLPFRAHAPAFPGGSAPTGPWGPRSPLRPVIPLGWTPKPVSLAALRSAAYRGALTYGRSFGVGLWVGSMIAEWAIDLSNMYLALFLNGLTLTRICDPQKGMDTWTAGTLTACLTSTGAGLPPRALPAYVAGLGPSSTVNIRFLGLNVVTPFNAKFYKESRDYGLVPHVVLTPRPRPHYSPVAPIPIAPPRAGALAPPGRVPWSVRPWPVWAGNPAGVPGVTSGNGVPGAMPGGRSWGVSPGIPGVSARPDAPAWQWAWDGSGVQTPSRPIPAVRALPAPGTREVKIGANTRAGQLFFGLMKARETVSEVDDFVTSLFRSLPKATQKRYEKNMGEMLLALYENMDLFDFRLALRNLIANQIEDEIIGRSYMSMRGAARNAVWGNTMGSLGPVNGPGFDDFVTAVSDAASLAADGLMGYENGPEHRIDKQNRKDREERRRALMERLRKAGLVPSAKSPQARS